MVVERLLPQVEGGFPVHRVAGVPTQLDAILLKEGHVLVAGVVRWRPVSPEGPWQELPLSSLGNDRWRAEFIPPAPGLYEWTVEAWPRRFATWQDELRRKRTVTSALSGELGEGATLLEEIAARADASLAARLAEHARVLRQGGEPALDRALSPGLASDAEATPDRHLSSTARPVRLLASRPRAEEGAWYEFFPRSTGGPDQHGTFATAAALLPEIAAMGFDVVYLPPIHPIGRTGRKGRNNSPHAAPGDVGSPWAIGAEEGGHDAVHPQLGTLGDFAAFVAAARKSGLEIALDLTFQCSPDHPWIRTHPAWFQHRPDGTLKTAENPPKRYDDVVNFDWLGPDRAALWDALYEVTCTWVDRGVSLFRVDNPHTKPLPFWEWFLARFQREHPEVVFLSEAFTRPEIMYGLARRGFHQSYTYFTWRTGRDELRAYLEEISRPPVSDFFCGNLWPNTPDILPEHLQRGGPAAFRQRLALAALASPVYGIYAGYELCEARALHGEEYLDSEKYQLVHRPNERPGHIRHFVARLNALRRTHPALRSRNIQFLDTDSPFLLAWWRWDDARRDQVLVAVSLDPYAPHSAHVTLPAELLPPAGRRPVEAVDLMGGRRHLLTPGALDVSLSPESPVAAWAVTPPPRDEHAYEYFA
ncbi:MAG: hypothetical protein RL653_893 [Pseudomonadota bacterium]